MEEIASVPIVKGGFSVMDPGMIQTLMFMPVPLNFHQVNTVNFHSKGTSLDIYWRLAQWDAGSEGHTIWTKFRKFATYSYKSFQEIFIWGFINLRIFFPISVVGFCRKLKMLEVSLRETRRVTRENCES